MKKFTLVVLFLLAGQVTFAKSHKHKKKKSPGSITSVSMRRTGCFGRCPDYTIEIDNDGAVTYTARRFCPDSGVFKKNIGVAKAMEVIGQFETDRVDTCQDVYTNRIQDVPGIILTIKYEDTTKTIANAHFGPRFLKDLAAAVDAAGKKTDDSWKKVADVGN